MKREVLLVDPITTKREYVSTQYLADLLECSTTTIATNKCRRRFHKKMNFFILPTTIKQSEVSKLVNDFKIEDEIWKSDKSIGEHIVFSNYGRVAKLNKDGSKKIYFLTYKENRKTIVTRVLLKDGTRKEIRPYRNVAKLFLNNGEELSDDVMVIHKNGIKWDNHARNLDIITRSEGNANFSKMAKTNKYVAKINPFTNEILDVYRSYGEASRMNNISSAAISEFVRKNTEPEFARFKWRGITEEQYYDYKDDLALKNMSYI